jgi:inner membrane protein
VYRKRSSWRTFFWICALALLSHIASDLITAYGTKILSPISSWRPALGTTFVIDPYFSAVVVGALATAVMLHAPFPARIGLLVLAAYLGVQAFLQHQAKDLGRAYVRGLALKDATVHALPQPLSPFNWLIIVKNGGRYHVARVNLASSGPGPEWYGRLGWLGRLQAAYQPRHALAWKITLRYGTDESRRHTAVAVWGSDAFAEFRRFARFPALYHIDETGGETCVWYTDLRYVLPGLTPPFRYGMCGRGGLANWGLYRLRRFTERERQYLGRFGMVAQDDAGDRQEPSL